MALDSKNNIKSVFIVPDLVDTPLVAGTKVIPGSLGAGYVAVCDVSNFILDNTGVQGVETIKIIKDRGVNLPLQQVVLKLSDVKTYNGVIGQASTEQVSYIGYNGTSGSISVINSNFYEIKLEHVPNAFAYGKRPANYKYGTYQSDATATEAEIANGLTASLVQNFRPNRTIDWRVFSEVTNAGTRTAATATAVVTLTFTKYSKLVTASAATASTNIVAGDYVAIDAATTSGVYKVASKDGSGNLVLDIAYQGETTTIVAATNNIRIAAATANAAAFGIKITGIKQKYDVNRWRQYDKVRFNVFLINFGTTGSSTTAAYDGIGVYEQAANDEYISWGDEGQIFVDQVPPQFREQDAVVGTQYNPAVLSWVNKLPSLIGAGENKGSAIFYIVDYTANQGVLLADTIEAWVKQDSAATLNWI